MISAIRHPALSKLVNIQKGWMNFLFMYAFQETFLVILNLKIEFLNQISTLQTLFTFVLQWNF